MNPVYNYANFPHLARLVYNVFDGPSNRNRPVGSYWFTVEPNTPLGENNFNLSAVRLYDTEFTAYMISNENLEVINEPFTVTKTCGEMAGSGAGLVGIGLCCMAGISKLKKREVI